MVIVLPVRFLEEKTTCTPICLKENKKGFYCVFVLILEVLGCGGFVVVVVGGWWWWLQVVYDGGEGLILGFYYGSFEWLSLLVVAVAA